MDVAIIADATVSKVATRIARSMLVMMDTGRERMVAGVEVGDVKAQTVARKMFCSGELN